MNATSVDLKGLLVAAGIGTFGEDIFISQEPDKPDFAITLFDTTEGEPDTWELIEYPRVQIRVRGNPNNYLEAYNKATEIKNEFQAFINQLIGTTNYIGIWVASGITNLGYDDNSRPLLVMNLRIQRAPTT